MLYRPRVPSPPPFESSKPSLRDPDAPRGDDVDVLHGVAVPDPYRWLEDPADPRVAAWTAEADALARAYLAALPGRESLAARFRELLYVESVGTPRRHGERWFFARRDAGSEKAIVYWRQGRDGADRVLLDPTRWSKDGSAALGVWVVSPDGEWVAYTIHENNSDEATLHVMDVATGQESGLDLIDGARYASPSWTPRGDGFFYTWLPPLGRVPTAERPGHAEVRFHALGTEAARDRVVHAPTGDPSRFLSADISRCGRWLVASIQHGWSRTDVELMDLASTAPTWTPLVTGVDAQYGVDIDGGQLFIRTNEGASRFRVMVADAEQPERARWRELIAERADATLESAGVLGHHLVLGYLKDATSVVEVRATSGDFVRELDVPAIGTVGGFSGHSDDDVFCYSFQSFTHPTEIFEASVATGRTSSFYRLRVPVDLGGFVTSQRFATSKDGTRVPFFVVHAKGLALDGKAPTMVNGYGGFQLAETPYFSPSIYPWLERGGVWVVANLRGGSEYGEEWHRQGMRAHKQNVFDDFFAVAEELVRLGYTTPAKLVARGGSNGGLLVGAAITQRPHLFRVALCAVPLLDMLRYQLFGSGKTWVDEFGSADDAAAFAALHAYSPYHRVTKGERYPSTLLLSADSDDGVDPLHARKFAAALAWGTVGRPAILRVEKQAGHGGADKVKAHVERLADEYAFALAEMAGEDG